MKKVLGRRGNLTILALCVGCLIGLPIDRSPEVETAVRGPEHQSHVFDQIVAFGAQVRSTGCVDDLWCDATIVIADDGMTTFTVAREGGSASFTVSLETTRKDTGIILRRYSQEALVAEQMIDEEDKILEIVAAAQDLHCYLDHPCRTRTVGAAGLTIRPQ